MRFPVYTATMIFPGVGPARMGYVEVDRTVYLANGTVVGPGRGLQFLSRSVENV